MGQFKFGFLGFRVGTPSATERTSLEKSGGADAWSVVDGITIDIKNNPLGLRLHRSADLVGRSGDDFILNIFAQHHEIIAVSRHTNQEGPIVIRVLLGVEQGFL